MCHVTPNGRLCLPCASQGKNFNNGTHRRLSDTRLNQVFLSGCMQLICKIFLLETIGISALLMVNVMVRIIGLCIG